MTGIFNLYWPVMQGFAFFMSVSLLFIILYRRMRRQQQARLSSDLEQLQILRLLLADFQRHRGLSNGMRSGDASLKQDLSATRQQLDACIHRAKQSDTSHPSEWHKLITQWQQIRQDSTSDAATNLMNHHELIRNTIFLIEDIANELDLSSIPKKTDYINSIWQEVVQTAEWTGQARALGTGIAAEQSSSAAQRVRLRFLHSKIKQLSAAAFTSLEQNDTGFLNLHKPRQSINNFLLCLEQELLNREQPEIEAKLYFDQATLAINDLLGMIDAALKDLQHSGNGN